MATLVNPYSDNGEWLVEHIREEGFGPREIAMAACVDISMVIDDAKRPAWERLSYVQEVLDVAHESP